MGHFGHKDGSVISCNLIGVLCTMSLPIILGSSSKWRRGVLADMLGLSAPDQVTCMAADIDEKAIRHAEPEKMVLLIAHAKAAALLPKIASPSILICSDQVIRCNGEVREKPENEEEARRFLKSYREHPAECINGVVVYNTGTGESFEGLSVVKQYFKSVPDELIEELIKIGNIFTCAGGFTVEDMADYTGELDGEISGVQGMPKTLTLGLIAKAQASTKQ